MKLVKYPDNILDLSNYNLSDKSIFLSGGITGWHSDMIKRLSVTDLIVVDPSNDNFDNNDPNAIYDQTRWEYNHLNYADAVLFWFPKESLCPITLYELGKCVDSKKPIFVGIHPSYEKRINIEIQLLFATLGDVKVVYDLNDLANQVINWRNSSIVGAVEK